MLENHFVFAFLVWCFGLILPNIALKAGLTYQCFISNMCFICGQMIQILLDKQKFKCLSIIDWSFGWGFTTIMKIGLDVIVFLTVKQLAKLSYPLMHKFVHVIWSWDRSQPWKLTMVAVAPRNNTSPPTNNFQKTDWISERWQIQLQAL